jgi:hypothetical protein
MTAKVLRYPINFDNFYFFIAAMGKIIFLIPGISPFSLSLSFSTPTFQYFAQTYVRMLYICGYLPQDQHISLYT